MSDFKKEAVGSYDADAPVRLNKFLSDSGICSRRQADKFIEEGKVKIDGKTAVLGSKVYPGQIVEYDGKEIKRSDKLILIAYNKPSGIECTADKNNPDNIIDAISYPERLFTIGRLDKETTGLILLTNTGEIAEGIAKSVNEYEKEYIVSVDKNITDNFLDSLRKGIYLNELDVKTKPCKVKKINKKSFDIILTQGLNRQIRRMCKECGYEVTSLKRIRVMNIHLGELREGSFRHVNERELTKLLKDLDAREI